VADAVTTPPVREVAGLEIPEDVALQVIEAFRAIYPTITAGKEDDPAVRAVLIWFITSTLETYQTRKIFDAMATAVKAVETQHNAAANQAREKIRLAAGRIKEKPVQAASAG